MKIDSQTSVSFLYPNGIQTGPSAKRDIPTKITYKNQNLCMDIYRIKIYTNDFYNLLLYEVMKKTLKQIL